MNELTWEQFALFLKIDKQHSQKESSVSAAYSRFRKIEKWFEVDKMPQNMVGAVRKAVADVVKEIPYSEYGWHQACISLAKAPTAKVIVFLGMGTVSHTGLTRACRQDIQTNTATLASKSVVQSESGL
ncbi:MAG: hypothetical protein A2182_04345 [Candidatus Pacebacteria bacterium RIFOXYA1_FULL_38_18]|nr:MAG: hypothetical protein A2182_04345 [Candidatus Pacebacteria bacterium RIFOXYA1_FULL_38_18]